VTRNDVIRLHLSEDYFRGGFFSENIDEYLFLMKQKSILNTFFNQKIDSASGFQPCTLVIEQLNR